MFVTLRPLGAIIHARTEHHADGVAPWPQKRGDIVAVIRHRLFIIRPSRLHDIIADLTAIDE